MSTLVLSTTVALSSSSWLMIWVCLEINTLAMCYILSKSANTEKDPKYSSMLYYLVQVFSSIIMLMACLHPNSSIASYALTLSLMIKLGAWPSHLWYMKVIDLSKLNNPLFILMTWQKILPVLLMMSQQEQKLIMFCSLACLSVSAFKLNKNMSIKSILGLSSLNNNGWLMLSAVSSTAIFMMLLTMYSASLKPAMLFFSQVKTKSHQGTKNFWESTVVLVNLSGMPPLIMFSAKIVVLLHVMKTTNSQELALTLAILACLFLYHYTWSVLTLLAKSPMKAQMAASKSQNHVILGSLITASAVSLTLIISLG